MPAIVVVASVSENSTSTGTNPLPFTKQELNAHILKSIDCSMVAFR